MVSYRGVVRGNLVVLDEPVDLADGSVVEVRPVGPAAGDEDDRRREERFKEHLVARGLLDRIRRPGPDQAPPEHTPIPILAGPLVSETVIEDRR